MSLRVLIRAAAMVAALSAFAAGSAAAVDLVRARVDADRAALCDRAREQGRAHARDYGMPPMWMIEQMSVCEGARSEWI